MWAQRLAGLQGKHLLSLLELGLCAQGLRGQMDLQLLQPGLVSTGWEPRNLVCLACIPQEPLTDLEHLHWVTLTVKRISSLVGSLGHSLESQQQGGKIRIKK